MQPEIHPLRRGRTRPRALPLLGCALLMIGGLAATHLPESSLKAVARWQHYDKLYHFTSYAAITGLLLLALGGPLGRTGTRWLVAVPAAMCLYAVCDEFSQPMFGRDLDVTDLYANWLGICAAVGPFAAAAVIRRLFGSQSADVMSLRKGAGTESFDPVREAA